MKSIALIIIILFSLQKSFAGDKLSKFELKDVECKASGLMEQTNELKIFDNNLSNFKCKRTDKVINCDSFSQKSNEDLGQFKFAILKDNKEVLELMDTSSFYWIMIEKTKNRYTSTNPIRSPAAPKLMSTFCKGVLKLNSKD